MEEGYELDLTYVTERIIAVSFPQDCFDETYLRNLRDVTHMLKSKHADNYLVINLSERKQELTKMNPKTLDTGWPDFHAPPLDKICTICKAIENWLNADPLHVVVIHCRGGKGRIGVVISSFVHFTDVSASADQALDRFAMRKFYDDKVSALMTPSQKRYVWILNSLLSGSIKMNTSPLFLHCVLIHGMPRFDPAGVCQLYLKVYQGMQVVYVSGVYHVGAAHRDRISIALEPAQLLKGDIMVKCFHKSSGSERDLIFRVQFHTGAVQAYSLVFQKDDMEHANKDARFPDYGKVELVFSDGPERISGSDRWHNGPDVTVDYMSADSLSKWNSYQNICTAEECVCVSSPLSPAAPLQSPALTLDRCSVRRNGSSSATLSSSPDHTLSASSDSGLSSASLRTEGWPRTPQPSQQERVELKRLLSGFGLDETSRGCAAPEPPPPSLENGPKERETDILDDEALASRHDLHSVDSLGTLSSSYHKSSQNSLLSDGFGSPGRADEPHVFQHAGYSTQTWVHQQQLVAAQQYLYLPEEDGAEERFSNHLQELLPKASVQSRCPSSPAISQSQDTDKKHDEEFSSLTLDIDNSIHQLNQLILDLDPTFVPISTKPSCFSRAGGADTQTRQTEHRFIMSPKTSDVTELTGARGQTAWTLNLNTADTHTLTAAAPHTQHAAVFRADGVQHSSHGSLDTGSDMMPSTPAFPITPTTPYVKSMMGYSAFRQTPSPSFGSCRAEHDMRENTGFMGASNEGFQHHRPYITGVTAFSDRSADCVSFAPSSGPSLPAPNAHSSPLSGPRARVLQQPFEEKLGLGLTLEALESDGELSQGSVSPSGFSSPHSGSSLSIPFPSVLPSDGLTVSFVQDTSKYWYKPDIAREQAITLLKDREPGSFIVRDSHSFRGAYGLAMKVSTPPPSALQTRRGVDLSSELVRHFLIECSARGVRLKGCPNEPYFGSLSALVCQHSITPLALPCKLIIPDRDPLEDAVSTSSQSITNSAAELLKQGAACNVWFLGSVEMESLTGNQAVQKATTEILRADSLPSSTVVHFKVSSQGITLTDNQRKLFFRRHYAVNTVIFCALDPQDRKWKRDGCSSAKIFGFVARKAGIGLENVCHVFAEHDPEQPASAIVNFVSKVMIGSQRM
ncbi:tensin-3-like isoform X1 [Onychostoma macrolepis]|uniref:tensin-3-like isoform X1 n=1 Tax=Onychostoma macrolepis TaxID=369639 RepID=UPI00272A418F|nr:tensin-3-like isoform X1 [Onychostoma macrolepis]